MNAAPTDLEAASKRIDKIIRSITSRGDGRYLADAVRLVDSENIAFLAMVQETRQAVLPCATVTYASVDKGERLRAVLQVPGDAEDGRYYVINMRRPGSWRAHKSGPNRSPGCGPGVDTDSCFEAFAWIATDAGITAADDVSATAQPDTTSALSKNIKHLCRSHGLSIKDLAAQLASELDQTQEPALLRLVGISNGWQQATTEDIAAIAKALRVTPETLHTNWETGS